MKFLDAPLTLGLDIREAQVGEGKGASRETSLPLNNLESVERSLLGGIEVSRNPICY